MGELKKKRENRCQSGFLTAGSNDSRIVHFCAIKSKTYRVTLFLITMAGLCLKTNQNKSWNHIFSRCLGIIMPSCLFLAALAFFCFKANVFSLYCRRQEADSSLSCNFIICPCGLNFEYQYMYWAATEWWGWAGCKQLAYLCPPTITRLSPTCSIKRR